MKDSYFVEIHNTPDGLPFAISMRADYRAEHQRGIAPLKQALTSGDQVVGIESLRVLPDKVSADGTAFQVKEGHVYGWKVGRKAKLRATLLIGDLSNLYPDYIPEVADRDKVLNGAWDSKNFIVSARDADTKGFLVQLAEEARRGNVLIFQGLNPLDPRSGGCLMLLVEDRTPTECLKTIVEYQERNVA